MRLPFPPRCEVGIEDGGRVVPSRIVLPVLVSALGFRQEPAEIEVGSPMTMQQGCGGQGIETAPVGREIAQPGGQAIGSIIGTFKHYRPSAVPV